MGSYGRWGLAGLVSLGLAVGGWRVLGSQPETVIDPELVVPQIQALNALGYIEPVGEVIQLSVSSGAESNRIQSVLVAEGDPVEAGQIVAVLDSRDRLQAALEQAQAQLLTAEATLAQVRAGAKQGEIAAQEAIIARLQAQFSHELTAQAAAVARIEAEMRNAEADYRRFEELYQQGAVSASERDRYLLAMQAAQRSLEEAQAQLDRIRTSQDPQLQEAQATLARIAEVRPVDVEVAAAEVATRQAAVRQAAANLELAVVRSPIDGQVLKLHVRPGESVGSNGILDLAQTQQMQVVAEVYESEIGRVQRGQRVQVYSDAMADPLVGEVERIGLLVQRQNVINADPSANVDARVVQVWIPLDPESSQKVAGLTNLQVTAQIQL